jgi:hypothetical protein
VSHAKRGGRSEGGEAACAVQFAAVEGALQTGEIAPAKDLGQGADREEKRGSGRNPARAVRRERAAGEDAVDVHVLRKILAPGVEHGGHAEVTAEVTRIASEAQERRCRTLKEQAIDEPRVTLRQRIERVGQREDDVEIRNGQHLASARGEPALGGHALTLRAVAIATGVVRDARGEPRAPHRRPWRRAPPGP